MRRRRQKDLVMKCLLLLGLYLLYICSVHVLHSYVNAQEERSDQGMSLETAETNTTILAPKPLKPTSPALHLVSSVTCPGLSAPPPLKSPGFQVVKGSDSFVYAAHQQEDHLIVIALVKHKPGKEGHRLYCQMWQTGDQLQDPLTVVDAQVELLYEAHGRRYTAAFIKCPIPGKQPVIAVGVVSGHRCRSAGSRLPPLAVTGKTSPGDKLISEFTVCVSPFNLRYSRAYELVEMVEFNKILGADKFVFYNYSIGPNVDRVLQKYITSGDVTVLAWNVPMRADTWPPSEQPSEVWYFGQLAALNDCLLRYRNKARYVVFSDLDEFIVPLKDQNWAQLLTRLRKPPPGLENHRQIQRFTRKPRDIFIFRCTFFRKEWPQPVSELQIANSKLKSAVLGFTLREAEVLPAGIRSKMIVNPRLVQEIGVHQVWQGDASLIVPQSLGLLYHYRSWDSPDQKVDLITSNDVPLRFGEQLAAKMREAWDSLPGVPLDIDIKSYGSSVS